MDQNQAPQGDPQKGLVFRTEEDRQKAYDMLPEEPPAGVTDIDTWRAEQDAKQDSIDNASIDPNYSDGQAPAPQAAPEPPAEFQAPPPQGQAPQAPQDWYNPSDWTFTRNGETLTIGRDEIPEELRGKGIKNAKDLILDYVTTHRYAETKKNEYQQSQAASQKQMQELQDKIKEYDKKFEELNKSGTPAGTTKEVPPSDQEITALQTELDEVTQKLDGIEEDDLSPENLAVQRKAIRLQAKLTALKDRAYNAKFHTFEEERDRARRDSEATQRRQAEEEKAKQEAHKAQEAKARMVKAVETFANSPESQLKFSRPFTEVEAEYENWATDIAATYFNLPQDQVQGYHAEVAVQNFLNRTPAFITKLTEQGKLNKAPKDLRKYLISTELYMMMQGQELDPSAGKWVQNDWRLPDMETAYERWKRKKGLKYQEEVAAANKAEEELLRVINPPNVAEQVPAGQGPQAQRDMSKIAAPQAENILKDLEKKASTFGYGDLEEWIESRRRLNPGDPDVKSYDLADEALMAFTE